MGSWKTDNSSGFLTGFVGTVQDSYADTDPNYQDGKVTLAIWDVSVDKVTQGGYEGEVPETVTVSFPMGKDWFSADGNLVEHPRNKDAFHASTMYGKLVDAITGAVENYGENASRTDGIDLVVDLTSLLPELEERAGDAGPMDMSLWKGLTFEFAEVHFDFGENRKTGDRIQTNRTMPVAVVGAVEDEPAKPAKAAAKKAPAAKKAGAKPAADAKPTAKEWAEAAKAKAAAKQAAEASESEPGDDPFSFIEDEEMRAAMNVVLATHDDFSEYIDALLEVDGAAGLDEDVLEQCMAEDGPWASKGA